MSNLISYCSIVTVACIWYSDFLPSTLFGVSCRCIFFFGGAGLVPLMGQWVERSLLKGAKGEVVEEIAQRAQTVIHSLAETFSLPSCSLQWLQWPIQRLHRSIWFSESAIGSIKHSCRSPALHVGNPLPMNTNDFWTSGHSYFDTKWAFEGIALILMFGCLQTNSIIDISIINPSHCS